jgi:hypothetical protein
MSLNINEGSGRDQISPLRYILTIYGELYDGAPIMFVSETQAISGAEWDLNLTIGLFLHRDSIY